MKSFLIVILVMVIYVTASNAFVDKTVKSFQAERTCGYNEICKEEFHKIFRCKCPSYLYCRSQGKYYNAVCSITDSGYIWSQERAFELTRSKK
ncbi:hypothetical protein PVAND_011653 [Polypedilum vanderplanki]|uniref:Uncharacterized protein n=1 Tax=Polypedilum vanderplanki TaxID=319348 RepID=A0A9J6CK07_POLVA|nr:hypothetical protein PVAND_011653 [Polypedilum vanderplanki]